MKWVRLRICPFQVWVQHKLFSRKFGALVSNRYVSGILRGYLHDTYTFLQDIVDRQTSMDTTSIGFSGVLFALNTITSLALESRDAHYGFKLSSLPATVQSGIMRTLGLQRSDSIMTRTLYIPARVWPLVQVVLAQLTDPRAVSFSGMSVCMYISMYVCMYVCILKHACMYVFWYSIHYNVLAQLTDSRAVSFSGMCMYVYKHVCMYVCIPKHVCMYVFWYSIHDKVLAQLTDPRVVSFSSMCMYVYKNVVCMYVCMYVCILKHVCMYLFWYSIHDKVLAQLTGSRAVSF